MIQVVMVIILGERQCVHDTLLYDPKQNYVINRNVKKNFATTWEKPFEEFDVLENMIHIECPDSIVSFWPH